jgi:hypothetical protein
MFVPSVPPVKAVLLRTSGVTVAVIVAELPRDADTLIFEALMVFTKSPTRVVPEVNGKE